MFTFLTRTNPFWWLLIVALIVTARANADSFTFSYTFVGTDPAQLPYAPGSKLFGQIEGTIDPDLDTVVIDSFGAVSLTRPGLPLFTFPTIENNEFNAIPPDNLPVISFSGSTINFRACPSGFTVPGDCPFATEGGFLVATVVPFDPLGFATASDGSGDAVCGSFGPPASRDLGCRVTDRPLVGSWSMAELAANVDPTVIIDPTVVIGSGSTVSKGVVLEENVELGENVAVDKNTSIGADTVIGGDVDISKNVEIGSGVNIGANGLTNQNVVIENNVVIGDFTTIDQGVHICSGVTIGALVTIGKNNLITVDVPLSSELPGVKDPAGDCP